MVEDEIGLGGEAHRFFGQGDRGGWVASSGQHLGPDRPPRDAGLEALAGGPFTGERRAFSLVDAILAQECPGQIGRGQGGVRPRSHLLEAFVGGT